MAGEDKDPHAITRVVEQWGVTCRLGPDRHMRHQSNRTRSEGRSECTVHSDLRIARRFLTSCSWCAGGRKRVCVALKHGTSSSPSGESDCREQRRLDARNKGTTGSHTKTGGSIVEVFDLQATKYSECSDECI